MVFPPPHGTTELRSKLTQQLAMPCKLGTNLWKSPPADVVMATGLHDF